MFLRGARKQKRGDDGTGGGINLDLEQRLHARRVLHHRVRVWLVLDLETLRQVEAFFELAADLHDGVFVVTVARPHSWKGKTKFISHVRSSCFRKLTNFVAFGTNVHNGTADIVEAVEGLANQAQNLKRTFNESANVCYWNLSPSHRVNPVAVELGTLATIQCDHPTAAVLVGFVLPHRPDVILEQRVVAADLHLAGLLDVSEQAPKVLNRVERRHLILVVFPWLVAIGFVVPQGPGVLQRVFDEFGMRREHFLVLLARILLKRKRGEVSNVGWDQRRRGGVKCDSGNWKCLPTPHFWKWWKAVGNCLHFRESVAFALFQWQWQSRSPFGPWFTRNFSQTALIKLQTGRVSFFARSARFSAQSPCFPPRGVASPSI